MRDVTISKHVGRLSGKVRERCECLRRMADRFSASREAAPILFFVGAMLGTASVLRNSLLLDYPFSPLPLVVDPLGSLDCMGVYAIFNLQSLCMCLLVAREQGEREGFFMGLFAPYVALGVYLFPYLTLHPLLLLVVGASAVACTALSFYRGTNPDGVGALLCRLYVGVATLSLALMLMAHSGMLPVATAEIDGGAASGRQGASLAVLEELVNAESLGYMSCQEAADKLQVVACMEASRLGLQDCVPRVTVGHTGTADAVYRAESNTITLSAVVFCGTDRPTGYEAVGYIAHEMAHAYECAVVDGALPRGARGPLGTVSRSDVETWRRELGHSVDSNRDFKDYWNQQVEVRARGYASKEMPRLLALVTCERPLRSIVG